MHDPEIDGRIDDPQTVRAFEDRAPHLAAFAEAHSLFVRKYIHNWPMWGFYFRHPSGGRGSLQLTLIRMPETRVAATVAGEWYVDDEVKLTRSTYSLALDELPSADPEIVVAALESALTRLLSAPAAARSKMTKIVPRPLDSAGRPIYGDLERLIQLAH